MNVGSAVKLISHKVSKSGRLKFSPEELAVLNVVENNLKKQGISFKKLNGVGDGFVSTSFITGPAPKAIESLNQKRIVAFFKNDKLDLQAHNRLLRIKDRIAEKLAKNTTIIDIQGKNSEELVNQTIKALNIKA